MPSSEPGRRWLVILLLVFGVADLGAQTQGDDDRIRDLEERILEGSAGGGVVKVYVNGQQEVQAVKISAEAVDPDDVETLEDLVTAAVRQAMNAAKELKQSEMSKVTGGMNLPGMGF